MGYGLVGEASGHLVQVARVVSPDVDSTVSQSGGGYEQRHATGHRQRDFNGQVPVISL